MKYAILGIGVDVNVGASEFPPEVRKLATSLKVESGETVDRAELATAILRELDADYARIGAGKFADIADEWERHCTTLGKSVAVQIGRPENSRPCRIAGR